MTMTTLAIDLGTSAIKLLRVDADLQMLSLDRVPVTGLDVDAWMAAIRENLNARADAHLIERIAVTGQMHGLITLENSGYGEGIPWTDQRGASVLPDLNNELSRDIVMRIGGPLASGFQAVSLAWIRVHQPERWSRIRHTMLPKDALIHALTGQHVTDPSDAVGTGMFDLTNDEWAWDVIDTIGISRDWLPRVVPSGSEVGALIPKIASRLGLRPGTPVVIAGGDAPVGAVGGGVTRAGQALVLLSSGAQIILPSEAYAPDPSGRWYTWRTALPETSTQPRFLRAGTLLNAGLATGWLRSLLNDPESIAPEPTDLIALPHLIGERTPLLDPDARGTILGITNGTTPAEISRAMLEGIAYSIRHALEVMSAAHEMPERIRLGGGGAQSDIWQTILTNVLAIPTERTTTPELTALGAAAIALGRPVPKTTSQPAVPDTLLVAQYDARYSIYRDALVAVTPISHRLTSLGGSS